MSEHRRHTIMGFTLVEVMIAMAILAADLVVVITSVAGNVNASQQAQMIGVVSDLARGKIYDVEEILFEEGFQEFEKELDGDFTDEGWPRVTWKAEVRKVELPNLGAMQGFGKEAAEGAAGEDGAAGSPLGAMLGGLGLGGADGLSPSMAAGAGLMTSQFETIANVLEESVRKVSVTVSWEAAGNKETMTIDCYFTDTKAVARVMGGLAGLAGGGGGDTDSDSGSGSDSDSTAKTPLGPNFGTRKGGGN